MKTNDFYEVDGCMDFIPVKIVGKSEDGVIVAPTNDKRDCQLVVEEVYRLTKPHEPQKVTVPKFVAEWIEEMKQDKRPLYSVMSSLMNKTNHEWIVWKGANMNFSEIVAQAWIYGYEIEHEKLYTVEIPNPNGDSNRYGLCKVDGKIIIGSFVFGLDRASNAKLTESEIKQDFEWAWQWAKEVE